ncbi:MAG: hypothetical protein PHV37_10050 [Candidatus Gastranaerophilales bacterium]|nr:hypothetical protein [Candidatus Gastranaerophilales bacterium]
MNISNQILNFVSQPKPKKIISHLVKDGALLPVILLESTVTSGRTLQAYKRSGAPEARERFIEESTGAVVWLFGVKTFNKIGDFVTKKLFKMPLVDFSVGKDPLRTPFANALKTSKEMCKNAPGKFKELSATQLASIKLGKIALSVAAATSFIGLVMPKVNHKITRKMHEKQLAKEAQNAKNNSPVQEGLKLDGINTFKNKLSSDKKPSFKGGGLGEGIANFANLLEYNPIARLISTDVGILAGRTANARNKDEKIEIGFRDASSIYFYMFSTNHVTKLLEKIGDYGKVSRLDPSSASVAHQMLVESLKNSNGKMDLEQFKKSITANISSENKALLEKVPFKDDVITLDNLKKVIPEKFHKKALEMSKLQPQQAINDELISVLSKKQVVDVLSEGAVTEPKFLLEMYKTAFGKELLDPHSYIPMKKINAFRDNIDFYLEGITTFVKKGNAKQVTNEVVDAINNKNLLKSGGFFAAGFLISAAFLSTIIPKTQYLITKLRTGKNEFPGIEAERQEDEKELAQKNKKSA